VLVGLKRRERAKVFSKRDRKVLPESKKNIILSCGRRKGNDRHFGRYRGEVSENWASSDGGAGTP